jgi:hypothetical protein
MPKINTKEDLKKYILLRCGAPVTAVELNNEHLEIVIDDAIQLLQRYNYGEGTYFEYGMIELKPGKTQYILRDIDNVSTSTGKKACDYLNNPENLHGFKLSEDPKAWENTEVDIEQIFEVKASSNYMGGINTMFTPMHAWWYGGGGAGLVGGTPTSYAGGMTGVYGTEMSNVSGNVGAAGGQGSVTGSQTAYDPMMVLSNYQWMMDYISSIEYYFSTMFQAHWRADAGILQIYPTPRQCFNAVVIYYKKENALYLYNNPLFKQLVVAMAKMQWGTNIGKYSSDLVGGGSVNHDTIKTEGKDEYEKIIESIKKESTPPDFFWA